MASRLLSLVLACALSACSGVHPSTATPPPSPVAVPFPAVAPAPVAAEEPAAPRVASVYPRLQTSATPDIVLRVNEPGELTVVAQAVPLERVSTYLAGKKIELGEAHRWTVSVPPGDSYALDVSRALPDGQHGVVALTLGERTPSLFSVSNLSVLLKSGKDEELAWVTRLTDGTPVEGADVVFPNCSRGKTDASGLFHARKGCRMPLLVRKGNEATFLGTSYVAAPDDDEGRWRTRLEYQGDIDESSGPAHGDFAPIGLDRAYYHEGQTLHYFGMARRVSESDATPLKGPLRLTARYSVYGRHARVAPRIDVPVSESGMFAGDLVILPKHDGESFTHLSLSLRNAQGKLLGTVETRVVPAQAGADRAPTPHDVAEFQRSPEAPPPVEPLELESAPALQISLDREQYAIGDVARVTVASPVRDGFALMTVERDGVLGTSVQTIHGERPVLELPLVASYFPSAVVSVVVVGQELSAAGLAKAPWNPPPIAVGKLPLKMHARKQLEVTVTSRVEGKAIRVGVDAADASGRGAAAEVLVAVSDYDLAPHVDVSRTLFARAGTVRHYEPRFYIHDVGCEIDSDWSAADNPEPPRAYATLGVQRVWTDATGHAELLFSAPADGRFYFLRVLAADRAGGVGETTESMAR